MKIDTFHAEKIRSGSTDFWLVTINGRIRRLDDWCETFGISYHTVRARMGRGGWSVQEALTVPSEGHGNLVHKLAKRAGVSCFWTYAKDRIVDQRCSQSKLARELKVPRSTLTSLLVQHREKWGGDKKRERDWLQVLKGERHTVYRSKKGRFIQEGDGRLERLTDWCSERGLSYKAVIERLEAGVDQALHGAPPERDEYSWQYDCCHPTLRQSWGSVTKPGRWERGNFGKVVSGCLTGKLAAA